MVVFCISLCNCALFYFFFFLAMPTLVSFDNQPCGEGLQAYTCMLTHLSMVVSVCVAEFINGSDREVIEFQLLCRMYEKGEAKH